MIFGILLILTVVAYTYLRIRTEQRLRRMPSDHHELTLQGPIMEYVRKNIPEQNRRTATDIST